jgi:hypothetical protein
MFFGICQHCLQYLEMILVFNSEEELMVIHGVQLPELLQTVLH